VATLGMRANAVLCCLRNTGRGALEICGCIGDVVGDESLTRLLGDMQEIGLVRKIGERWHLDEGGARVVRLAGLSHYEHALAAVNDD
jgi:hypothetical protein